MEVPMRAYDGSPMSPAEGLELTRRGLIVP